jgi:hypothetical protein
MATAVTDVEAVPVSNLIFHHIVHYFATDHPRGRIRQGPYPTISRIRPYPPVLDPSLTWPRSSLDLPSVSREKRPTWHRTRGLFTVSSSMSPWYPGARRYSHLHRDRQNFTSKAPRHPCLILSYKRAGRGSTRRDER